MPIGPMVVCYLFLGGAGAGALFFMALMQLKSPLSYTSAAERRLFCPRNPESRFFSRGYTAALIVLSMGATFLLFDLGRIDRALSLFFMPTVSFLTFGSYALLLTLVCAAALSLAWSTPGMRMLRVLATGIAVIAIVASLCLMAYTGFLLYSLGPAIDFWNSPLIPALFILSALSTGIALIVGMCLICDIATRFQTVMRNLMRIDVVVIAVEALVAIAFMAIVNSAMAFADQLQTVESIGANVAFAAFILLGLLLPFALEAYEIFKGGMHTALVSSASILVGGFCLRLAIAGAGVWAAGVAVSTSAPLVVL